jgi:DNA-binding NarL/FixJ family response regulator
MAVAKNIVVEKTKKKIFIVDDHPIIRDGLRQLISKQDDMAVCGEAEDAYQALNHIGKIRPHLVIVDISLSGGNGLELIKSIKSQYPDVAILVVSMHDESLYAERSIHAGARGYIMKSEASEKVLTAMRSALAGKIYLSEGIRNSILEKVFYNKKSARMPLQSLSDRELQVFQYIAEGYKRNDIAGKLHTSVNTIDTHYAHIKKKLGLKNGNELTKYAINYFLNNRV